MGTFCSSGDQEKPFDSSNRPQAQEPVRTETKADFGSHVSAAGGGLDRGRAQDGDKSDGGGVGWLPAGLRAIWDRFADDVCDEEGGSVLGERAGDFLRELRLDPEGVESFAFFWKLQHESFGTLSRDEFAAAMFRQGVWHEDALREWARRLKSSIATDSKSYRQMYRWLFGYLKEKTRRKTLGLFSFGLFFLFYFIFSMYDHEPDPPRRQSTDIDVAMGVWDVVLQPKFALFSEWKEYLDKSDVTRGVNEDVWNCIFDFAHEIRPDLSNYEREAESGEQSFHIFPLFCFTFHLWPFVTLFIHLLMFCAPAGSWPIAIDEFFDFVIAKRKDDSSA